MTKRIGGLSALFTALLLAAATGACREEEPLTLPTAEQAEEYFSYQGHLDAELSGNVVEITVVQPAHQLRRGGSLWARVGPYVFLFSGETRQLFRDHPGVAAVRVVTESTSGEEVARAMLRRGTLNELTWRRALNISGHARRDGTERPSRLEDLIRWGEEHTDYSYSPDFTGRR